ncbi:PAS domain-containing protein [Oculatella sp. FACHB-28]|uniref:PAS domain-containing protein n=1 Tax=Oculatella sp. FACHB-28 TaxID=2692845 RepID=UPI001684EB9C|nr:PAS domain-containing protein [Oculatella sp. FACHB-28]MBD2059091.1 PAS domain-containing protein [Oculatella sp. FACHB-28]
MSRILLLLEHRENRRLLCEWLEPRYDMLVPDWDAETVSESLVSQPFDLCIIGARALDQLWQAVQARRTAESPVLLPFLLATSRQDVKYVTRQLWQSIDELITQPIEKAELQARVEILLRSRQLSLQLQTANQKLEQQMAARQQAEAKRDRAILARNDSEDRFRQMAETIQSAFWLLDLQTQQMLYLSPAYEQIWGRPREELYADYGVWMQTIHPDDRERIQMALDQGPTSDSQDDEYRIIRPDGSIRWVRDRCFVSRNSDGEPYQLAGVTEDITDRKQTEIALQKSEQRYRDLAEAMPQVVWLMHPTGTMQYFNQHWYDYTGLSEAESIGFGGIVSVHPDDRDRTMQVWRQAIATGNSDAVEYRLRRFDGIYRWFISQGVPLRDSRGTITSWIGTITDIDHQKQIEAALREREAQLQFVLDSSQIGEWELDLTIPSRTSRRSLLHDQIFGYDSLLPEWNYGTLLNHIHPDDRADIELKFQQTLSTYEDLDFECRITRADGYPAWIAVRGSIYQNIQGQPTRLVGIITDITDRKQAEAEREQLLQREQIARETAEQANRIKDEFLAVLSHELRSPLNPILGWAKLLQTREFDAAVLKKAVETIERNAKLQAQLIEDLLDVSRILQGKVSFNTIPINLVTVIESSIETVRLASEAKMIEIQTDFDASTGEVLGDPNRLQQVVWNLLSNAIKFTPEGGRVEVKLEQVQEGQDARQGGKEVKTVTSLPFHSSVQLTVSDTGKGISPDFLPHVFDYFRQADSKTTRKFGGLGLGLAIVRHLVELHGGTVWAESLGEGQGATFIVRLPLLSRTEKGSKTEDTAFTIDHSSFNAPLTNLQILVVDDDTDTRDFYIVVLKQAGATVTAVSSAEEALQVLAQLKPNILLSDIGMPDMDGYMLIRQIRAMEAQDKKAQDKMMPAIALTAYAGEPDQKQAIAAGFQHYMSKPIEPQELVKAIANLTSEALHE